MNNRMRLFFTAAILLLLAAGCTHARADPQINLQPEVQKIAVEDDVVQGDGSAGLSAEETPLSSQVIPLEDGKSLLESRCAQCHLVDALEQMEKSREEWEAILAQMERMDVRLSDVEKAALLDYLATNNVP